MENCPFCQIVERKLPASFLYEDEDAIAIQDIHPLAPIHILILPKKHIDSMNTVDEADTALIGRLLLVARKIAFTQQIGEPGYRIVINTNRGGGQTVFHLHIHLLGGAPIPPELLVKGLQ
jgi:histidine triad (HIT) family protein